MARPFRTLEERFWPKVEKTDSCWLWTAALNQVSGYGMIGAGGHDGRMLYAHRVAYELVVGPIPDGMTLDHLCNVRRCVNPEHLSPCSTQENSHRGKARRLTCSRGHLKEGNTYTPPDGRERCRICNTMNARAYRDRQRS